MYDRTDWGYCCAWFLLVLTPDANVECDFGTSGKALLFDRIEKGRDITLVRMPHDDTDIDVAMPCSDTDTNEYQTCARRKDGSLVLCIGKGRNAKNFI